MSDPLFEISGDVKGIFFYGEDVLETRASEVSDFEAVKQVIASLAATVAYHRGLGMAAPQIGISQRVFVLRNPHAENGAVNAFVNPEIVDSEGSVVSTEGCLSIPGVNVQVKRASRVLLRWQNLEGEEREEWLEGDSAIAAQHEFDHLNGIHILSNLTPLRKKLALNKHRKFMKRLHRAAKKV